MLVVLVLQIAGNLGLHRGRHSGVVWNLGRLRLIQIDLAVPVRRQAASVCAVEGLLLGWHLMGGSCWALNLLHGVRRLRCRLLPRVNLVLELISGPGCGSIRVVFQWCRSRRRADNLCGGQGACINYSSSCLLLDLYVVVGGLVAADFVFIGELLEGQDVQVRID